MLKCKMKAHKRIHGSVPRDEKNDKDKRSCEERHPEGELVEDVESKAGCYQYCSNHPAAALSDSEAGPAFTNAHN